jgi:tRNA pseudouridine38-40 synthase
MEEALPDFHARFSAKSRSYLYLIAAIKTPFYKNYSHYDYMPLSITGLNELSEVLTGEQDYASFTKNAADADSTICNVTEFRWRRTGAFILMKISANRFLHGMVRALCGTVISVYKKGGSTEDVKKILDAEDRTEAAMSVPAKGLFLWKVHYD